MLKHAIDGYTLSKMEGVSFGPLQLWSRQSNTATALQMLGTTRKGLTPLQLRTVQVACVASILLFSAAVWYTGKRQAMKVGKLDVMSRRSLRHILGAFKTTPSDVLYTEASVPPMSLEPMPLVLQLWRKHAAVHIARLHREHAVKQRLGGM